MTRVTGCKTRVEELRKNLMRLLKDNEFPSGKFPSENELCRQFKVSRPIVREATVGLMEQGLLLKVRGKGTFLKHTSNAVKEFAVIYFDIFKSDEPFTSSIIEGIESEARRSEFNLHLYTTRRKNIREKDSILKDLILNGKIDGLFILSPLSPDVLKFFQEEKVPFVVIANEYPGLQVNTVNVDYYQGTKELVNSFIKQGCRRIGLLTGPFEKHENIIRSAENFLSGYKDALAINSLKLDLGLLLEREHNEEAGYQAMKEYFSMDAEKRPDSVIISSAHLTEGALRFVREKGLEDAMIIVGTYNGRTKLSPPGIMVPLQDLGRMAFKLLEAPSGSCREPISLKVPMQIVWK
jgi:DNA-binding LacI/PurR family transcriptional regulator